MIFEWIFEVLFLKNNLEYKNVNSKVVLQALEEIICRPIWPLVPTTSFEK
jgi:hypothetical protein